MRSSFYGSGTSIYLVDKLHMQLFSSPASWAATFCLWELTLWVFLGVFSADKLCMWPCHLVSYILSSNVDLTCVLNSTDARFGILNVHADINDCTWGLYKHLKKVCVESWLWGKSPCCTGNWTGISSTSDPALYQMSQIPAHQGTSIWWDYCHTRNALHLVEFFLLGCCLLGVFHIRFTHKHYHSRWRKT